MITKEEIKNLERIQSFIPEGELLYSGDHKDITLDDVVKINKIRGFSLECTLKNEGLTMQEYEELCYPDPVDSEF